MKTRAASDTVFVTDDDIVRLDGEVIDLLRGKAPGAARKRVRFNAHRGPTDAVQEMIIALARDTYIPPHRHVGKSESYHVIEGDLAIVLFRDGGTIREVVSMGPFGSGKTFYYRNDSGDFHAVVAQSASVIFHETTNGPFVADATVTAPWAPDVEGREAERYLEDLRREISLRPT